VVLRLLGTDLLVSAEGFTFQNSNILLCRDGIS